MSVLSIADPYMVKKRAKMDLPKDQKASHSVDVFKGRIAEKVNKRLASANFELVPVPANMVLQRSFHEQQAT